MLDLESISALAFFAMLGLLLIKDKKKLEIHKKIIIIRRWERGKEKIYGLVKKHSQLFLALGNLAILASFFAAGYGIYYLVKATLEAQQAFGIVLPSVGRVSYPAPIIGIPFWYWLIGIFVVVICHETMHALLAVREGVNIKNYGIVLLLLFPLGAFVDPDEKKLKKLKLVQKLRVYAAGSFSNLVVGFIFLLLASFAFQAAYVANGALIVSVVNNSPAFNANLSGVIHQINNHTIKSVYDLKKVLQTIPPDSKISIITSEGNYTLTTSKRGNKSFIGVGVINSFKIKKQFQSFSFIIKNLLSLSLWLFIINVGVGIINLLPIKPLDGGLMLEEILKKYMKKEMAEKTASIVSYALILLLIFNLMIKYLAL